MDLFARNNIINFSCSFCGSLYQIKGSFVLNFASLFTYKFLIFVLLLLCQVLRLWRQPWSWRRRSTRAFLTCTRWQIHMETSRYWEPSLFFFIDNVVSVYIDIHHCQINVGNIMELCLIFLMAQWFFTEICGVGDEICAYPWKVVVRVSKEVISR